MPLNEMGSSPALLSVANQATENTQRNKIAEEQLNQKAVEGAQALPNKMADQALEKQMNMVTITPQLAQGATKATGDESWSRAVGTKMDARIYSALLQYGSSKKLSSRIVTTPGGTYMLNEQSGEYDRIGEGKSEADMKKIDETHKVRTEENKAKHGSKMEEIDEAGKFKGKGRGGSAQEPQDKEFLKSYRGYANDLKGFNSTLLAQLAKQDPTKAKELQDKQIFLQKNKQRFDQLQGLSGDQPKPEDQAGQNSKALDWLKQNYPKLTNPSDHDVEWALTQMTKKK